MPDEARDAGEQDGHSVLALPLVDPVTSATLPFKPMAFLTLFAAPIPPDRHNELRRPDQGRRTAATPLSFRPN